MRRCKGRVLSLALCALLCLFSLSASVAAFEDDAALTLLFTTDIHSNIVPHLTRVDGKAARIGGYARLKTAVDANRREGKTLLLDSGDFSVGTLYENFNSTDVLDLRLLDALNYDAVALGNHDFDAGAEAMRGELTLLSGNLIYADQRRGVTNPLAAQGVRDCIVVERGGYRIGLFSVMGKDAVSYTSLSEFSFASPVKSAQRIVTALREMEKVDLVVMLSHAGTLPDGSFTEDAEIARAVKGIDVILSGHEHVPIPEIQRVGDTMIVCAGTALNYLGRMDLSQKDGKWTADYELIPLDDRWTEDAGIADMIAPYTQRLNDGYLRRLGVKHGVTENFVYSPYDFPDGDAMGAALRDYAFGRLLTDAYFYALSSEGIDDVDIALVPNGTVRAGLYRGNLQVMDVYNVLSYGSSPLDGSGGAPVACVYLTGGDLYDLCEASASLSPYVNTLQFLFGGLRYSYCSARPI